MLTKYKYLKYKDLIIISMMSLQILQETWLTNDGSMTNHNGH